MYDILIIGAGVSGCAVARELSRYRVSVCVLEKEEDVCCGTSKANSAIIHAGYDAVPGSNKARLNVRGNELMEVLAKKLDFEFRRIGSLVVCFSPGEEKYLQELYRRGKKNGIEGMRILNRDETASLEPGISSAVHASLYAPGAGIVCPFELNLALAENAYENGVEFRFHTRVFHIEKYENSYMVETNRGKIRSRIVVNAAGVYADQIHNMVSDRKIKIMPRRGEYCILDHSEGTLVSHIIFGLPGASGKGILVTPTVHGNLLFGPTAEDIEEKENTETTARGLREVTKQASHLLKEYHAGKIISSFAGLRAHGQSGDFLIGEAEDAEGFIDCAGIESPGLTSAPAIGEEVAHLLKAKFGFEEKENFVEVRRGITKISRLSEKDCNDLVKKNPAYGKIVCRCETITEGEIIEAVRRPLGARSLDGVKRRTRAGMGRCQAGFCMPGVLKILADECGIPMEEVTKSGGDSQVIGR